MELEVLFEDRDLVAINKPAGVLVESSLGNERSLLDEVGASFGARAIAYHRLDRATTGVVLFGKTARLNREISVLFSEKKMRKEYWALVRGDWPKALNKVESRIGPLGGGVWSNLEAGGKKAETTFRCLGSRGAVSWIQVLPKTGRTHQIRLHCLKAGFPILGDSVYGEGGGALALHARSLRFRHPVSKESVEVRAPLPKEWDERLSDWDERERRRAGLAD